MRVKLSHWGCRLSCWSNGILHSHYIHPNPNARHKTHSYKKDRFAWSDRVFTFGNLVFRFFTYRIKPVKMNNKSMNMFKKDRILLYTMPFKIGEK